jgi:hypothetical protein
MWDKEYPIWEIEYPRQKENIPHGKLSIPGGIGNIPDKKMVFFRLPALFFYFFNLVRRFFCFGHSDFGHLNLFRISCFVLELCAI